MANTNKEREKMVLAMEYIVRHVNNEDFLDAWLMCGVADGDIEYGSFDVDGGFLEWYTDDDTFSEIMGCFLRVMERAKKDGGLYCDKVVSE